MSSAIGRQNPAFIPQQNNPNIIEEDNVPPAGGPERKHIQAGSLRNQDFTKTIEERKSPAARIGDKIIAEKLKVDLKSHQGDLPPNATEKDKKQMAKKAIQDSVGRIHSVALAMQQEEQPPSIKKYWDKFTNKIKDSSVGKFWTRKISPIFVKPEIKDAEIKPNVLSDSKVTQVKIDLGKSENMKEGDNVIQFNYKRMRGPKWYQRWFTRKKLDTPATIQAKITLDIAHQARLRNLGIGLSQEMAFKGANPGLSDILQGSTAKNINTFSTEELKSLKQHFQTKRDIANEKGDTDFQKLDEDLANIDKAITFAENFKETKNSDDSALNTAGKKAKQKHLKELSKQSAELFPSIRKLAIQHQIDLADPLVREFGVDSFTPEQIGRFNRLKEALVSEDFSEAELTTAIQECGGDLQDMSVMTDSTLRDESHTYKKDLAAGLLRGVIPDSALQAPAFFSQKACENRAKDLRNIASEGEEPRSELGKAHKKEFEQDTGKAPGQSFSDYLKNKATFYDHLAEAKGAMHYRFQGLLPMLAANNEAKLEVALYSELENSFAESTGLRDNGDNLIAGVLSAATGIGAMVATVKGKPAAAAGLFAASAAAYVAAGPNAETKKYRQRLAETVSSIMEGMAIGTREHLVKTNQILAEGKASEQVEKWATLQANECKGQSQKIGDLASLSIPVERGNSSIAKEYENVIGNKGGTVDQISTHISEKIASLETLKKQINTTKDNINVQNPVDSGVKIGVLTLEAKDIEVQDDLRKELQQANDINQQECDGVIGSYKVLQSLYQNGGSLRTKAEKVEQLLAGRFKSQAGYLAEDQDKDAKDKIKDAIAEFRQEVQENYEKLTNEHADHLESFISKLEESRDQVFQRKDLMRKIATGIVDADEQYINNGNSRNGDVEGAYALANDLEILLKYQNEASLIHAENEFEESYPLPHAFFKKADLQNSFQQSATELRKAAQTSIENWKTYSSQLSNFDVLRNDSKTNIATVKESLSKGKEAADADAQKFSSSAQPLATLLGVEEGRLKALQSKLANNIQSKHDTSLLRNLATRVQVDLNETTRHGLCLLAGPLADGQIPETVAIYLTDKNPAGQSDREATFATLVSELPTFDVRNFGNPDKENQWKDSLSGDDSLHFITSLIPEETLSTGVVAIDRATELGKSLMGERSFERNKMREKLYKPLIDHRLQEARVNPSLIALYGDGNAKELTNENLLEVSKGLFSNNTSNLHGEDGVKEYDFVILAKYFKGESLGFHDNDILQKTVTLLSNFKKNPEESRIQELTRHAWNMATAIDPSLKEKEMPVDFLKSGNAEEIIGESANKEGYSEFKSQLDDLGRETKKLQEEQNNLKGLIAGQKLDFTKGVHEGGLGGSERAFQHKPGSIEDQKMRFFLEACEERYKPEYTTQAGDSAQSISQKQRNYDYRLNEIKRKYDGLKGESSLNILRYMDTTTMTENTQLRDEDKRIYDAMNLARNQREFKAFRNFNAGVYQDEEVKLPKEIDKLLDQKPLKDRPLNEKSPSECMLRFDMTENHKPIERALHLKKILDNEKNLNSADQKSKLLDGKIEELNQLRNDFVTESQQEKATFAVRLAMISTLSENGQRVKNLPESSENIENKVKNFPILKHFPIINEVNKNYQQLKNCQSKDREPLSEIPNQWINDYQGHGQHASSDKLEKFRSLYSEARAYLLSNEENINYIKSKMMDNNIEEINRGLSERNASNLPYALELSSNLPNEQMSMHPKDLAQRSVDQIFEELIQRLPNHKQTLTTKKAEILNRIKAEGEDASWSKISETVKEFLVGKGEEQNLYASLDNKLNPKTSKGLSSLEYQKFEIHANNEILQKLESSKERIDETKEVLEEQKRELRSMPANQIFGRETFIKGESSRNWISLYLDYVGGNDRKKIPEATSDLIRAKITSDVDGEVANGNINSDKRDIAIEKRMRKKDQVDYAYARILFDDEPVSDLAERFSPNRSIGKFFTEADPENSKPLIDCMETISRIFKTSDKNLEDFDTVEGFQKQVIDLKQEMSSLGKTKLSERGGALTSIARNVVFANVQQNLEKTIERLEGEITSKVELKNLKKADDTYHRFINSKIVEPQMEGDAHNIDSTQLDLGGLPPFNIKNLSFFRA